ncbi:MAG: hypothetical protein ACOYY2_09465 [Actinomycetota bacterium]
MGSGIAGSDVATAEPTRRMPHVHPVHLRRHAGRLGEVLLLMRRILLWAVGGAAAGFVAGAVANAAFGGPALSRSTWVASVAGSAALVIGAIRDRRIRDRRR